MTPSRLFSQLRLATLFGASFFCVASLACGTKGGGAGDGGGPDAALGDAGDGGGGDAGSDAGVDAGTDAGTPDGGGPGTQIKTVFLILMENHNWSDIKGQADAPFINNILLPQGAHAENYYDNPKKIHPSEPNYIWLEAGDNLGITDDKAPAAHMLNTPDHLVTQLNNVGVSWRSYQEDLPAGCPVNGKGLYAPKHDPMLYFTDVSGDPPSTTTPYCVDHHASMTDFAAELAADQVAQYNFIVPNLCNDMHNSWGCGSGSAVSHGDAWLARWVPKILASKAYQDGGAIFITWDESEGGEYPIGLIAISPLAKQGYSNTLRYYHSSMLRTVEEVFGVPLLRDAQNQASLSDLFTAYP